MSAQCLTLLCCFLIAQSAFAVPMDPATRQKLEQILAARDANRGKIHTLRMSGMFQRSTERGGTTPKIQYLGNFEYFEHNQQRRLDEQFRIRLGLNDAPDDLQGKTFVTVVEPTHHVSHTVGVPESGGVGPAEPWPWWCCFGWLEATRFPRDTDNDIHRIRRLLTVDRFPGERWRVDVKEVGPGKLSLLDTESWSIKNEFHFIWRWTFDLDKGGEIVAAHLQSWRGDGSPWYDIEAKYDVREVASGVWRVVGVDASEKGNDGKMPASATIKVSTSRAVANAEPIPDETFSPRGIGMPAERIAAVEAEIVREKSRAATSQPAGGR